MIKKHTEFHTNSKFVWQIDFSSLILMSMASIILITMTTYFIGSNHFRNSATTLISKSTEMVFITNKPKLG
jgi:hypothetical protein